MSNHRRTLADQPQPTSSNAALRARTVPPDDEYRHAGPDRPDDGCWRLCRWPGLLFEVFARGSSVHVACVSDRYLQADQHGRRRRLARHRRHRHPDRAGDAALRCRSASWPRSTCPSIPTRRWALAVRFGTDVLSGLPSIVVGLFVYALIVPSSGLFGAGGQCGAGHPDVARRRAHDRRDAQAGAQVAARSLAGVGRAANGRPRSR